MKGRRKKGYSRFGMALGVFGMVTVFSIITVLLYATPASPKEIAVTTAIVMAVNAIWLPVVVIWERIMEKRRRDRQGG